MCKISVLFKPSRSSWICAELQKLWFIEIKYKELEKIKKKHL